MTNYERIMRLDRCQSCNNHQDPSDLVQTLDGPTCAACMALDLRESRISARVMRMRQHLERERAVQFVTAPTMELATAIINYSIALSSNR